MNNKEYAVKIKIIPDSSNERIKESFYVSCLNEIFTSTKSSFHENSIKFYDALVFKQHAADKEKGVDLCYAMIMELGESTLDEDIFYRSKDDKKFTEKEIIDLFKSMVKVLAALQKMNISHRDIKPHNIAKVKDMWKLFDYDASKSFES